MLAINRRDAIAAEKRIIHFSAFAASLRFSDVFLLGYCFALCVSVPLWS